MTLVAVFYYIMVAYVIGIMIWNFIKTKDIKKEILYALSIVPFLLRLLRMK